MQFNTVRVVVVVVNKRFEDSPSSKQYQTTNRTGFENRIGTGSPFIIKEVGSPLCLNIVRSTGRI